MAYFDNAATTYPKPECVYQYMDKFYRECGGNAGRGNYEQAKSAGELIANTRSMIQDLLHCPTKQVVFEPTATIALNLIIQGNIERGAHNIYVSPFEHNAVTRVLHHFEKQEKIVVRQLTVGENLRYDMERIRYQFEEEKPDFVIVSHASNSFGVVALLEDIFALAKKYGARTLADMSQTAGLIDTNVGLETFDYAVFAGHKTLYGPTGISGFVMNPEADFPAVLFGGTGFESANQDMPESLPQKYEAGTLNIAGVAGLYAAIKWINETGLGIIWEKEQEHRAKLMEILSGYDFIHVVGADKDVPYVGIVSCLIDGISSDSAGNIFDEQGISVRTGLECAPLAHQFMNTYPAGTIRFSVSYFTSDKDFKELVFSGEYDKDQNSHMISNLQNIVRCVSGTNRDLTWLNSISANVLKMTNFSDKDLLLMNKVNEDRYPKPVLRNFMCQYLLSGTYMDMFDETKKISVFCEDADTLEAHHIIPLGSAKKVGEITADIRKNPRHICNSPLNFVYITKAANKDISDDALDAYEKKIQPAAKAALFISSYTPASHDTEIKVRGLLESRYSMMQGTISGEINDLLTNWM